MTARYPELARLGDTHDDLILDGELVTLLDGKPSFRLLQQRMQVQLSHCRLCAEVVIAPAPASPRRDVVAGAVRCLHGSHW
jgi:bifunctional non-homologous end joining protein LigD